MVNLLDKISHRATYPNNVYKCNFAIVYKSEPKYRFSLIVRLRSLGLPGGGGEVVVMQVTVCDQSKPRVFPKSSYPE